VNTKLDTVTLKTGESMDILRVTCPDGEWADKILPFLAHKGSDWQLPMEENLKAPLEGLGQHFYIGVVDGDVVGNCSSIEGLHAPVGILQHVFTPPEQRRKGICKSLIHTYVKDFDARGGRAAYLHTGYDSAAYHIYASAGFVGYGETGTMERFPDEQFHQDYWKTGWVQSRETRWEDWALLEALYGTVDGWHLRSTYFSQYGRVGYEGTYVYLRRGMDVGSIQNVRVLEGAGGAVVGHAYTTRLAMFNRCSHVLDFFLHPNHYASASVLLNDIDLHGLGRVLCYCDSAQPERGEILVERGFTLETTMPRQLRKDDEWLDVLVYGMG